MVLRLGVSLLIFLVGTGSCGETAASWWRIYVPVVSSPNRIPKLEVVQAGAIRGAGYHGGWYGFWSFPQQRESAYSPMMWEKVGRIGAKRLIYFDAGEVGDYVGFFTADGKMRYTGWSIPYWKGEPVTPRWFGLQAFMQNVAWAPYPTARCFNLNTFTAPGGERADDLYAVLSKRDLNDRWDFDYFSNPNISDDLAFRTGLAALSARQQAKEDVQGKTGWRITRLIHIDHSNPQLRAYHCRELEFLLRELRPDGFHIDNFGDVDIFCPYRGAFGLWSIHTFRQYMREHFTPQELRDMGIEDIRQFDIRAYIRQKPFETRGKEWPHVMNRRWTEDLVWKCYLLNKVETDLAYHRALYETVKRVNSACAVTGNLIPLLPGSALMKGACDIAHFEWMTVGGFGELPKMGLPPKARAAYVTRLAAAISDAGYCWPSLYVPKTLSGPGHENLHKVLAFDCLANRGLMDYGQWFLANYTPGTPESAGFVNGFIRANAAILSKRRYLADVALVFCPWSEIAASTVWGTAPEMFVEEYAGWADFLSLHHYQWDVTLSQDVTASNLRKYPIVILPSVMALSDGQVVEVARYVEGGGYLVATGLSGTRFGPEKYLMPRPTNALGALRDHPNVRVTAESPGVAYRREGRRANAIRQMTELLSFKGFASRLTTDAPETVGVNLNVGVGEYESMLTLDLNNYDLNVETDAVTAAKPCTITIRLPEDANNRALEVSCMYPGMTDTERPVRLSGESVRHRRENGTLTIKTPGFEFYLMVLVK